MSHQKQLHFQNRFAQNFEDLKKHLNLTYDAFIRTTNVKHKEAAQEMWRRCRDNGDIYKKQYAVKYCVGCELEKTDSELVKKICIVFEQIQIQGNLNDDEEKELKKLLVLTT